MKKRILATIAAVMVLSSSMTVFAASSKTTSDVAAVTAAPVQTSVTAVTPTANGGAAMSAAEQSAMTYRSEAAIQAVAAAYEMRPEAVANNSIDAPTDIPAADSYQVSQGDKIKINGLPSSTQHVFLRKITKRSSLYSKIKADLPEGMKLGSYFNAFLPVKDGNVVSTNFYLPKLKGTENVVAQQYVDGAWVTLEISEIRKNHIVLDLDKSGAVRFLFG